MTNPKMHNNKRHMSNRHWPFRSQSTSPLAWWRTLPSDKFRDAEKYVLGVTLDRVDVLRPNAKLSAALRGNAAAAIAAAYSYLPIEDLTLEADMAMSTVLRWAIDGNPACTLVLATVLKRTDVGHSFGAELSASWFFKHTINPNRDMRPSVDEAALVEAVHEHYVMIDERGSA